MLIVSYSALSRLFSMAPFIDSGISNIMFTVTVDKETGTRKHQLLDDKPQAFMFVPPLSRPIVPPDLVPSSFVTLFFAIRALISVPGGLFVLSRLDVLVLLCSAAASRDGPKRLIENYSKISSKLNGHFAACGCTRQQATRDMTASPRDYKSAIWPANPRALHIQSAVLWSIIEVMNLIDITGWREDLDLLHGGFSPDVYQIVYSMFARLCIPSRFAADRNAMLAGSSLIDGAIRIYCDVLGRSAACARDLLVVYKAAIYGITEMNDVPIGGVL